MRKTEPGVVVTPTIQVIERMFALIDVLASREEAISLKEISEKTGLHPSTTHRILNDLATGRFVDRPEAGNYRLGMRLLELGNLVKEPAQCPRRRAGPMRELHNLTQQPVNLSMRQGDEIVYVERAYSERSGMQVVRAIGGRAPLHLTSVGKLFLAADDRSASGPMPPAPGLHGQTRNSITHCPNWSANSQGCASTALRATTKSSNSGFAAWRRASTMIREAGGRAFHLGPSQPADDNWLASSRRPPTRFL
jgi:DNA-binding IclR family transcriptional regulator